MTTQKQIVAAITTALKPLVGGRVTTRRFAWGAAGPVWPAIRINFISGNPTQDICGDGGEEVADYRVQIDVGDLETKGEASFLTLCSQVMVAMALLGTEYRWSGMLDSYDEELKVNLRHIDFIVYLSS
jgi:hypothetical protein